MKKRSMAAVGFSGYEKILETTAKGSYAKGEIVSNFRMFQLNAALRKRKVHKSAKKRKASFGRTRKLLLETLLGQILL